MTLREGVKDIATGRVTRRDESNHTRDYHATIRWNKILKMSRLKNQQMVTLLPPDGSTTFLAALLVPLILGFLVGTIAKGIFKVAVAAGVLVLLLIVLGMISPQQIIGPVVSLFRTGSTYTDKVRQIAGYLPYSSLTFIVGLVVGFFKG